MSLKLLKKLRSSVVCTCLVVGALTVTACQPSETDENVVGGANTEETVPMSAEPADHNDVVIDVTDESLEDASLEGTSLDDVEADDLQDDTAESTDNEVE